ncbi:MAG: hypothetical protein E5X67_34715 [Mesorhizobium sp.]|uniref:hypothetical protein n=1 Tax=Mesorhizobium sp. TaxID=1871066 RepID=UPI00120EEB75|nr:hypothetical protein [Mesorhizobium sp.]TIP23105.1 MAG: hypothetical protein E5X67_34715 [Mesorhizobium sp.]
MKLYEGKYKSDDKCAALKTFPDLTAARPTSASTLQFRTGRLMTRDNSNAVDVRLGCGIPAPQGRDLGFHRRQHRPCHKE